ncbi:3-oxoacyl-ACP synthase [Crocinitomix catalasitica]|nr:3-oxoacyl-ACP synthase [Crocinitomix catalasitica]
MGEASINGSAYFNIEDSDFLKSLYKKLELDYSKFYKMDRLSKLGFLAVELILKERSDLKNLSDEAIAMVFQSENGCLETDVNHQNDVNRETTSPAIFVYTLSNIVIGEISIKNKWHGESAFFIEKTDELKNLLNYSKSLILSGKAEVCFIARLEAFEDRLEADLVVIEDAKDGVDMSLDNLKNYFGL